MSSSSSVFVTLAGGQRVEAQVGRHTVRTDQPESLGGEDSAPAPFDLFLASLGTCAGFFVQRFCAQRGIDTEGVRLTVRPSFGEEGTLSDVDLTVDLPPLFPAKYREALVRVVDQCSVKRAIQAKPVFTTHAIFSGALDTPVAPG